MRQAFLRDLTIYYDPSMDEDSSSHNSQDAKVAAKREAARQRSADYRAKDPELAREKAREWRRNNPEKAREISKRAREKNRERIREYQKKWTESNSDRVKHNAVRYYQENKDKIADQQLMATYGIARDQYWRILASQGGGCRVCGSLSPGKGRYFAVDHNHSCCPGSSSCGDCIRGLLCVHCNVGLGHFRDSIETLYSAIAYLENTSR